MAALPYMQLYVADYLADTAHLTTEEHGAYLLLLFSYWQTGKPLRIDRLSTVARVSNERWPSVAETLVEFFNESETHWTHFRVEADLEAVNSKSTKASAAGKASAKARFEKKQLEANAKPTDVATVVDGPLQRNGNHTDTDTDTDIKPPLSPLAENPAPEQKPKPPRKCRLPEPFNVTGDMRKWAAERTPGVSLTNETEKFVNHWRGNGQTKADWIATWRNWLLKAQEYANQRTSSPQRTSNPPLDMTSTAWAQEPIL